MKIVYLYRFLLIGLVAGCFGGQQNLYAQGGPAMRFSKNITAEHLSEYLHKLASKEFEGRETGQKGQKEAATYIAAHFRNHQIPPLNHGTYFQDVPLTQKKLAEASLEIDGYACKMGKDFYFSPTMGNTHLAISDVTVAGYGIHDSTYSDYKGVDLKGKDVLILSGEPKNSKGEYLISKTTEASPWSQNRTKVNEAKKNEVKLLIIVDDSLAQSYIRFKHFIETPTLSLASNNVGFNKYNTPTIFISTAMANKILAKSGSNVKKISDEIAKTGQSVHLQTTTNSTINIKKDEIALKAENVLGYIEGSDLREEVVVVTAHYDHLGIDGETIYYGADDDGSGTAAVMELAAAFAEAKKMGNGPRRSMLFMTVCGEEKGLLGSEYYSQNPVFPLKNTVADLNIDMIGRLDEKHAGNPNYIYIIGSDKLSSDLHKINERANRSYTKLSLDYTYNDPKDINRYYYRSDHYNFAKNNIPVIFYFSGVHADYHKPTDTVDKIDFQKMEKITKLVYFTAWELANRSARIKVDVKNSFKNDR